MNNIFFIPPAPNWFNSQILACAPDNTLVYGTKNDLAIIHPMLPKHEFPKIEVITEEIPQKMICVDVTPKWNLPNKWILCTWEENQVKIWDMKKQQWKKCQMPAKMDKEFLIGARFLSEDSMLGVTASGTILTCYLPQLKFASLSNVFNGKVIVTCFAPCPHSPHITALGLKNGLIVIMDIRNGGSLMHKLRGHTGEVISLSWCPSPINIFPEKPGNQLRRHKVVNGQSDNLVETDQDKNGKKDDKCADEETNMKLPQEHEEISGDTSLKLEEKIIGGKNHRMLETSMEHTTLSSGEIMSTEDSEAKTYEEVEPDKTEKELSLTFIENGKDQESSENFNDIVEETQNKSSAPPTCVPKLVPCEIIENGKNSKNLQAPPDENVEPMLEEKPFVDEEVPKNTSQQTFIEEIKSEFLLASCAKDGYVNIWKAKSDGRLQCFIKINDKKNHNNRNQKSSGTTWFAIKWITPFSLLIGTKFGEIFKYVLPKPMDEKKQFSLVHNEHKYSIFVIAAYVPLLTEKDWFVEKEIIIWTFAHDMVLLNTVLNTRVTHLTCVETFCALVLCLTYSPLDPNRIALGLSNGTVKIWNANSFATKYFFTTSYSLKIYGKITCLEWHPTNELMIGFGTEEGTTGFIDTNNYKKATWFIQYFSSTIHRIQWAPYAGKICMYVLGKGRLVVFDPDKRKQEPIVIEMPSLDKPYNFSWKLDMSMMLLSNTSLKITLYDSNLALKATYFHTKKISHMLWHPDSENATSPRSFWVATALENVVHIFDFAEVKEKQGTLNIEDVMKTKISVHYAAVKSMSWNVFNGDQLATAGEDGLAYVLDVPSGTILSSYYDPRFQPIKTIMWSPFEEDLLLMSMLRIATFIGWEPSEHKESLSTVILRECETHTKNFKKANGVQHNDEDFVKKAKKIIKSAKNIILPSKSGSKKSEDSKLGILTECIDESESNHSNKVSVMGELFGTKEDILSLLNQSEKNHLDKGRLGAAAAVSAFKGDLKNHITEAIEQYRVNPCLIALAPSVSISLWQKACETFASQLSKENNAEPLDVVLYYLACQNIERAIEYLCEKQLHKEALTLAKSRLPQDSVIIENIIKKWAQYSSSCGNLETGALCYIKLGNYEEASKLLFRRNDGKMLHIALALAKKTENLDLIKGVEFRLKRFEELDNIKASEKTESEEQVGECSDNAESSELQDASETQEAEYDNLIKKLLEAQLNENTSKNIKAVESETDEVKCSTEDHVENGE